MRLRGCFLDNALLSIARFLLKRKIFVEESGSFFRLDSEIKWILNRYRFVDKDEEPELIEDIKRVYAYVEKKATKSINSNEFARFAWDNKNGEKTEREIIKELESDLRSQGII